MNFSELNDTTKALPDTMPNNVGGETHKYEGGKKNKTAKQRKGKKAKTAKRKNKSTKKGKSKKNGLLKRVLKLLK
jgi:hypothetical protein|uniref:Uncharacterized protein n=1 Tax=viral metagenome TaxID=1070528 RepID=A0A6C0IP93_9ZZZZ